MDYTTKPVYRNYLKDLEKSEVRHSIDYSSLNDVEYATFEIRKREKNALRREQYLNNIRSMEMENYMSERKKIDEDYLESAKAKIAILNKY